jgi:glyoxylase-like metal-dependent hydrolase (beta-lactamase superfamily II)
VKKLAALLLATSCSSLGPAVFPSHTEELAPGAWAVQGGGGNSLLVETRGGLLLVDPKWGFGVDQLRRAALEPDRVRWIVDTHWHPDHSGGRSAFPGAVLFAAPDARTGHALRPEHPIAADLELKLGGERVELLFFAAHTRGDLAVWLPERRLLATGDLVMTGFVGHTDGGSWLRWLDALERLAALSPAPERVVTGHGAVADVRELMRQRDFLRGAAAGLRARRPRNELAEELRRTSGLADFPLVSSLDTLLEQLEAELSAQPSAPQ